MGTSGTLLHGSADPCRGSEATKPLNLANALRGMAILKQKNGGIAEAKALWEGAGRLYESVDVSEGVVESAKRVGELSKGE
jgi:hypothetical protein